MDSQFNEESLPNDKLEEILNAGYEQYPDYKNSLYYQDVEQDADMGLITESERLNRHVDNIVHQYGAITIKTN